MPRAPELLRLVHADDAQRRRARGERGPADRDGAVAIGVRLHDGVQPRGRGPGGEQADVVRERVEVDLGPDRPAAPLGGVRGHGAPIYRATLLGGSSRRLAAEKTRRTPPRADEALLGALSRRSSPGSPDPRPPARRGSRGAAGSSRASPRARSSCGRRCDPSYAPGCGPCITPAGWCEIEPGPTPRREVNSPRT